MNQNGVLKTHVRTSQTHRNVCASNNTFVHHHIFSVGSAISHFIFDFRVNEFEQIYYFEHLFLIKKKSSGKMLRSLLVNEPTANAMKSIDPMSWILIWYSNKSASGTSPWWWDDVSLAFKKNFLYGLFFFFFMCANTKFIFQNNITMCKNDYN